MVGTRHTFSLMFVSAMALCSVAEEAKKETAQTPTNAELYDAVKISHPRLFDLMEQSNRELLAIAQRDNMVPDVARRNEMVEWRNKARNPQDSELILNSLLEARAQDPPDWPVVSVALSAATQGISDPRVLELAENLLAGAAQLPDEAMIAVAATHRILALSGRQKDIDLLAKATSRKFMGVKADVADFGSYRQILRQSPGTVLFLYTPLDQAIPAFERIIDSHSADHFGLDGFIRNTAEISRHTLNRVRNGEQVEMLAPEQFEGHRPIPIFK